jgi:hypothetical protein
MGLCQAVHISLHKIRNQVHADLLIPGDLLHLKQW